MIQRIRCLFQLGDYQSESIRVYPSAVKSFSGFFQRERDLLVFIVYGVQTWSKQDLKLVSGAEART